MATRTLTVEHNGVTYSAEQMTIRSTMLGYEDHGILTVSVACQGAGSGVSFGGYALDEWRADKECRIPTAYGLDHVVQIMRVVGVESWEKLPGKQVLIL